MQTGQGAEVEDTSLIHENEQAEHGKKSLMGKVKDKAKKLRSKMKSPGKKSEDKESSHASDEDDEDNASSSPEAETPPFSPQVSSQKQHPFVGTGSALKSDEVAKDHGNRGANFNAGSTLNAPDSSGTPSVFNDKKFDLKEGPVSPTPGTKNTESKYDHGLRAAADRPPSESETTERQHNFPAAAEHPSAGIAGGLQFRDPKPAADHASGDIYSKKSDYDLPPVLPEGDSSAITNKVDKPQDSFSPFSTDDKFSDSQTGFEATGDKRFSPVGSDGNTGQKATESFNAAKGAVAEKLGYGEDEKDAISSEEKLPASVGAHETTYGASATAPKPATDRASGALTAAKDTVVGASTAGVGAVKSALYPSDESAIATKNRGESLPGGKNPEKSSQSWTDWAYSAKDAVASNLGMNPSSPSAATTDHSLIPPKVSENQTRPESPTSLVKDDAHHDPTSISRGLSSDPADSTPSITDKFKGTVQSLTDSFSSTLGLNSPSATSDNSVKPVDPDQKGATQKIWDSAASAKDAVASRLGYASPSPNQKHNVGIGGDDPTTKMDTSAPAADQSPGVFQRGIAQAKDGAVSAKDSAVSYFHPGHEDAALSEKITQMFSPSKAKESIFGGTGPHSGVTTADPNNTSSAEGAGVVSRVTDAVSSMFGSKSTTNTDHPQHTVHSKENSGGGQTDGSFSNSPASEQNIIH